MLPYIPSLLDTAPNGDFGFDPPASMRAMPKFLSPRSEIIGDNTRTQLNVQSGDPCSEAEKVSERRRSSIWKPRKPIPYRSAGECTPTRADTLSTVLRHGQITPPTSRSPSSHELLGTVKHVLQAGTTSKKKHLLEEEVAVNSALSLDTSSSSTVSVPGIKTEPHGTKKPILRRKTSTRLTDDRKRKLSLERNRIAAASCRSKKKRREDQLQTRSHAMASRNEVLKKNITDMTEDIQQLKSVLGVHLLSGGCDSPAELSEVLNGQSFDDSFHQKSSRGDDQSEMSVSLQQGSSSPRSYHEQDILAEDLHFQRPPPVDIYSWDWEPFLPSLDLVDDFEIAVPDI